MRSHPRSRALRVLRWAPAALAGLLLSCGGKDEAALPPPPPVVEIKMRDYSFEYKLPIPRGRVILRGHNLGRVTHRLTLLPLPADFPPLDQQLRGKTRATVVPLGHLRRLRPGESDAFAVDLAPGRYGMVDFERDRKGIDNAIKGSNSEFRVR